MFHRENISRGCPCDSLFFNRLTAVGQTYTIAWNDRAEGNGVYQGDVKISAYHLDTTTPYFRQVNHGYVEPQRITADGEVIYIYVELNDPAMAGSFAVKVTAE